MSRSSNCEVHEELSELKCVEDSSSFDEVPTPTCRIKVGKINVDRSPNRGNACYVNVKNKEVDCFGAYSLMCVSGLLRDWCLIGLGLSIFCLVVPQVANADDLTSSSDKSLPTTSQTSETAEHPSTATSTESRVSESTQSKAVEQKGANVSKPLAKTKYLFPVQPSAGSVTIKSQKFLRPEDTVLLHVSQKDRICKKCHFEKFRVIEVGPPPGCYGAIYFVLRCRRCGNTWRAPY